MSASIAEGGTSLLYRFTATPSLSTRNFTYRSGVFSAVETWSRVGENRQAAHEVPLDVGVAPLRPHRSLELLEHRVCACAVDVGLGEERELHATLPRECLHLRVVAGLLLLELVAREG